MNNKIDVREIFSKNLRYYRLKANLTQSKLSELVGVTDKYISDLERNLYDPSLGTLEALAVALNIETYLLLKYDKEHTKTTAN